MISDSDKTTIETMCQKYQVKRAILFGSSLDPIQMGRDIDLAVDGLAPRDYFRFYGELMCALSKPVDVVDLTGESKFIQIVKRTGMLLYG
jgi:predicted nucleotidyltransferase